VHIREAKPEDAAAFLALYERINSETHFMLFESGELQVSVETQSHQIEQSAASGSGVIVLSEINGQLVGFARASRSVGRRQAHCLYIGIGVLQAWVGRGIGAQLMTAVEQWAHARRFHRLELMVNVSNHPAIALYKSLGFEREGVRRHGFKIDGEYIDLFYMSKLIGG
jgi:RimJ/RimL family protein N-acetyltransferase